MNETIKKHGVAAAASLAAAIFFTCFVISCNGKKALAEDYDKYRATTSAQAAADRETISAQSATIDRQVTTISRDSVVIVAYKGAVTAIVSATDSYYTQVKNAANNLPK